jgi:hypothetical protein
MDKKGKSIKIPLRKNLITVTISPNLNDFSLSKTWAKCLQEKNTCVRNKEASNKFVI